MFCLFVGIGYLYSGSMSGDNVINGSGVVDLDKEFYELVVFINGEILYLCICIFGLFGNIFMFVVLFKVNMFFLINVFLSVLVVLDMVSLINDIIYFLVMVLFNLCLDIVYYIYVYFYFFVYFVFNIVNFVLFWFIVFVVIECFLLVCFFVKF